MEKSKGTIEKQTFFCFFLYKCLRRHRGCIKRHGCVDAVPPAGLLIPASIFVQRQTAPQSGGAFGDRDIVDIRSTEFAKIPDEFFLYQMESFLLYDRMKDKRTLSLSSSCQINPEGNELTFF